MVSKNTVKYIACSLKRYIIYACVLNGFTPILKIESQVEFKILKIKM